MDQSITFSAFRTETAKGTHEFKITSYSLHKGLNVDKFVESKTFSVGGYEWTIRFFPGGGEEGYIALEDVASLFIHLASNETNVRGNYELTLVDQSGENKHIVRGGQSVFDGKGSMWGFDKFVKKSLLEDDSDYIKNDCIIIRCHMKVVVDSQTVTEEPYTITVPPPIFTHQFGQFLESGEGTDVRFLVGGETFAAHKFVLAVRSPVFKAQFFGPMKDDDTKECIEIVDMKATVFKALLHYIYWDALPGDLDFDHLFAHHLLEASDRYGLERLRLICEAKLCEGIDIDTAATTLALGEQHHCSQLKSVCFRFIAQEQNFKGVVETDDFRRLQQTCPSVGCELIQYMANPSGLSRN